MEISPSRLTHWIQGKIDPNGLEIATFYKIARAKGFYIDELAKIFGFTQIEQKPINKFRDLIKDLLLNSTQEELGKKIGVTQISISNWLNPNIPLNPAKIPAPTMFALAQEKGWTLERLLNFLNLEFVKTEEDLFFQYKLELSILSLKEQIKIANWLSNFIDNKIERLSTVELVQIYRKLFKKIIDEISNDRTVCIILETENLAIASNYASNLAIHLNLKPENIKVTTIPNLPESIADIDILIFDISNPSLASIALIEDIEFDRDIVVFANADLPVEVRSSLEDKVTDVVVKPIDWQELKDKAYFC